MSTFVMRVGTQKKKKFQAKTVDLLAINYRRWRDRTISMFAVNTIGTHWPVRYAGRLFGELTYDGKFWPADTPEQRPCDVVHDILAQRFTIRDTHSVEYREGVRVALEWRLMRAPMGCPYASGTVQADAFLAGIAEGRMLPMETPVATPDGQPHQGISSSHSRPATDSTRALLMQEMPLPKHS